MKRYICPDLEGIHPLRLTMTDKHLADIMEGIQEGADWMTLEELDAAQDYIFDLIVAEKQNTMGVTILQ